MNEIQKLEEKHKAEIKKLNAELYAAKNEVAKMQWHEENDPQPKKDKKKEGMKAGLEKLMNPKKS